MRRTIDTLHDGLNRAIRYRAPRYTASEMGDNIDPALFVAGRPYLLRNLSADGLAFQQTDGAAEFEIGQHISMTLNAAGELAYRGEAEVLRIESTSRGERVAVRLKGAPIDIEQLMARHSELRIRRAVIQEPSSDLELVHSDYRAACADVVHLLRRYSFLMDDIESHFQRQGNAGAQIKVLAQCERNFRREWLNLCANANAAARQCLTNVESVMATKRFTEAVVTPELIQAPIWRHAYEKKSGFAPDAQLLTMLFSGARLGANAYSRMLHQMGLEHPVAAALVSRMRQLKELIAGVVAKHQDHGTVRVTSLGCGPAKEVVSFLMEHKPISKLQLTLIDRCEEALAAAHHEVTRMRSHLGDKLEVDCLYVPLESLLNDTEIISGLAPQHLIYSAGLLDTIANEPAQALIKRLYHRLCAQGQIAMGAMVAPGRTLWTMEFVLDWSLVYRSASAMDELTAELPTSHVSLESDENDVSWMLHIHRKD